MSKLSQRDRAAVRMRTYEHRDYLLYPGGNRPEGAPVLYAIQVVAIDDVLERLKKMTTGSLSAPSQENDAVLLDEVEFNAFIEELEQSR